MADWFRIYLFGDEGRLRSAEVISASSEADAVAISEATFEACADVCCGFELWSGALKVASRFGEPDIGRSILDMEGRLQGAVADFEEVLTTSYTAIRDSRRLLDRRNAYRRQGFADR